MGSIEEAGQNPEENLDNIELTEVNEILGESNVTLQEEETAEGEGEPTFNEPVKILSYDVCEELAKQAKIRHLREGMKVMKVSQSTYSSMHIHRQMNLSGVLMGLPVTLVVGKDMKDGVLETA